MKIKLTFELSEDDKKIIANIRNFYPDNDINAFECKQYIRNALFRTLNRDRTAWNDDQAEKRAIKQLLK